jgi:hypothetical protein
VVNVVVEGRAAGRGRTSTSNRAAGADEHVAELSASARPRPRRRPGADATIEPHRPLLKLKVGSWLRKRLQKEIRRKEKNLRILPAAKYDPLCARCVQGSTQEDVARS